MNIKEKIGNNDTVKWVGNIFTQWIFIIKEFISLFYFVIGGFIIFIGHFLFEDEIILQKTFNTVGVTVITSNVFMAILKSKQFTKIFIDHLKGIIFCTDYLKNRKDLNELWQKTTKSLYEEKFPELANNIEKSLEKYIPINSDRYYKDYTLKTEISFDPENKDYIIVKDEESFILMAQSKKEITYNYLSGFSKEYNNDKHSYYQFQEIRVNGRIRKLKENELTIINTNKNRLIRARLSIKLKGLKEYKIEKTEYKRYSLNVENTKSHSCGWIFSNYRNEIIHPKELEVKFYPTGSLEDFKRKKREINHGKVIEQTYTNEGILFPNQGTRIIFRDKRK
ncbi:hypothetical protein Q4595_15960 [Wenyingzhuangia sp. 1_MG-2023]|nr:hypothetical protein [Wenyingzhuangia sp. 1_MG-2023]